MNSVSRNVIAFSILSLAVAGPVLLSGCEEGEDPALCTCDYQGMTYEIGESFAAADGCNTCVCAEDGSVSCTKVACPGVTCSHQGAMYQVGQQFPAGDGCNTCSCAEDGKVTCTEAACIDCTFEGGSYVAGQSFPAADGCNTCVCAGDGSVVCSDAVCCDPAAEPWRTYHSDDPAACAQNPPVCPAPMRPFQSECGCGCEDKTAKP